MKSFAAAKAKLNFGELLDEAQKGPVTITKKDRPVAVLLSKEEYERLEAIEDAAWADRAQAILDREKPLSHQESIKALEGFLRA